MYVWRGYRNRKQREYDELMKRKAWELAHLINPHTNKLIHPEDFYGPRKQTKQEVVAELMRRMK